LVTRAIFQKFPPKVLRLFTGLCRGDRTEKSQELSPFAMRPPHSSPDGHNYRHQLTDAEIAQKVHRDFVGGMWDEIGQLQFDFLRSRGLAPRHRLLDVGCGALRGGLHFIRFLETGHYYGTDMNASLIKAAYAELKKAGLEGRQPHLLLDEKFNFARLGTSFHFAIAHSLFTHLSMNSIERCLVNIAGVLEPGARFYATYFESPRTHHLDRIQHPGGIVTYSDADPYHYPFPLFQYLLTDLPLAVNNIGPWGHPRSQHMLEFSRI
jgi:SAM-dependent methyltransferase